MFNEWECIQSPCICGKISLNTSNGIVNHKDIKIKQKYKTKRVRAKSSQQSYGSPI
mgnify:CR=1 FL=1